MFDLKNGSITSQLLQAVFVIATKTRIQDMIDHMINISY